MRTLIFFCVLLTYFALQPKYDLPEFSLGLKAFAVLTGCIVVVTDLEAAENLVKKNRGDRND